MGRQAGVLASGLAGLLLAGSCSFAFVDGPPPRDQRRPGVPIECNESRAAPVFDVGGAVYAYMLGAGTMMVSALADSAPLTGIGAGLIALGIVYTVSASHGFRDTAACERARNGLD